MRSVLLRDYLVECGFQSQWFNELKTIARQSTPFLAIFPSMAPSLNFFYEPFNWIDRRKGRRLYLRDIFTPEGTYLRLHKKLERNAHFIEHIRYTRDFRFGEWYRYDLDDKRQFCIPEPFYLIDERGEPAAVMSAVTLT